MKQKVSVSDLRVGYILEEDVKTSDGKILIKKGIVLTENLIMRLRQWNAKSDCKLIIDDCREEFDESKLDSKITSSLEKVFAASPDNLYSALLDLESYASHIYDDLKTIEDLSDSMIEIRFANSNSGHYFRVAKMACALANLYNREIAQDKKISLNSIALSSLLHDYGKRFKNDLVSLGKLQIDKKDTETMNMLNLLCSNEHKSTTPALKLVDLINGPYDEKYHSLYAYVALKDVVPEDVRATILYSSSTEKAFQGKAKYNAVVKAANIIAICNTYDTLLEYVVKEDMSTPFENVISYMSQLVCNGALDEELYNLFLRHISIYPNGSKVLLSNDQYAVVVRRTSFPTKPVVLTLPPAAPALIDLSETTNLIIRRIVRDAEHVADKINAIQEEQLKEAMPQEIIPDGNETDTLVLRKGEAEQIHTLRKRFKGIFSNKK